MSNKIMTVKFGWKLKLLVVSSLYYPWKISNDAHHPNPIGGRQLVIYYTNIKICYEYEYFR